MSKFKDGLIINRTFLILMIFFLSNFSFRSLSGEENFLLIEHTMSKNIFELGSIDNERITPCSTFKIALSLIGFDSGMLKNKEVPVWDFQEDYSDYLDSWKTSQTPQSWMKNSCVWYSQVLTAKLGSEIVQNYLNLLGYGNQDISGGLTKAWLSSSLKISLKEQIDFLQKMVRGELPISNHAVEMTKSLLFLEELPDGWKLFGKTGLGNLQKGNNKEIGWFIGWIEKDENLFIFAYNIRDTKVDPSQRIPRVKQLLAESHVMNGKEEKKILQLMEQKKMEKISVTLPKIKLVGICVRTGYQQELDKINGNIFPCVKKYYHEALFDKITNRKKPGTTFCVYTDYETNYTGAYTYFIGEEVSSFDPDLEEKGFQKLIIPEQKYAKFTNGPAAMPDVIVKAWEEIWEMSSSELGGTRRYDSDFEIYDERATDHENIILDVFVGIQ